MQVAAEPCLPLPEFRALIDRKAKWQVDQFLFGRQNGERPTLQTKRFIEGIISADYHGRTLIELIQNAHDAHDKDAVDGRIRVVLDETEGRHGTLYVANGGHPLTPKNFAAMVDVAVSDKPPSEGIGNKGVGFKSVLQFSDCPEVYSRSSDASTEVDGFTFRFGTRDDFDDLAARWAPQENGLAAELADNISTLTLTFPLANASQRITNLNSDGFCTVIRLPLKSERALDDARSELKAVAGSDVPMHLFLDRIETIDLITIGADGEESASLTRLVEDIDRSRGLTRSLLQDDSEFIIARRAVPESAVLMAIEATRDAGAHLPGWDRWEGDAEVVLALAAGAPLDSPRLYNFLPMGERVECPLPAYLQAPFFSSLDRRSLDESYPINGLFLDEAAALAADLLIAATEEDVELPPGALADLGCWSAQHLDRLTGAMEERQRPFRDMAFLPTREAPDSRTSMDVGLFWDFAGRHFAPELLPAEQLKVLIDPLLGSTRLGRIKVLNRTLGYEMWHPAGDTLVEFAETCAARLQADGATPDEWAEFYDELAEAMPWGTNVAGANIVAGVNGLLPANGVAGNPTVFFPPQRGATEARTQPPNAVASRLAYVRELPWRLEDQSNRPGRQWLAEYVAEFGSEDILRVVADVMSEPDLPETDLVASLSYALDVWRNARSPLGEDSFPPRPFRVPTPSGWVDADQAFFGKGWEGDDAWVDETLVRLLDELGPEARLGGLADHVLRAPSEWVTHNDYGPMREFLERAGVRHGLWPCEPESVDWSLSGEMLNAPTTIPVYMKPTGIAVEVYELWRKAAQLRPGKLALYSSSRSYYQMTRNPWLPGQSDWTSFSSRGREIYGELILAGLDRWDERDFEARFDRNSGRQDFATWPSLVASFLLTYAWFPQREPGDRTTVTLTSIADAWWLEGDAPPYLPAPSPHLRRSIGPRAIGRLRELGARHWDAEDSAVARIEYLADLISQDGTWVRGTRAEYERSWTDFLNKPTSEPPRGVLVERLGAVELVDIAGDSETIYYAVPDVPQAALLAQLPLPRLGFTERALSRRVGRYLSEAAPHRFRSVADAEIKVLWTEPTSQGPLLDLLGDWFETLVLLVLSHQQGVLRRGSRQLEQVAHRLRTTELLAVDEFSTSVDGYPVQDSLGQASCWVEDDDGRGVVLVRQAQGLAGIELAERASEGIAQAVESPAVFKDLRLALVDLRGVVRGGIPSNADLARALRLPEAEVELARAERGAVRPDTSTLVALLAMLVPDVAEELRDLDEIPPDRSEMQMWLDLRLSGTAVETAAVLRYEERGWTTGPIEEGLVSLKDANEGLRILGLEPVANTEAQRREFVAFVASRRAGLVDELRDRFLPMVSEEPDVLATYASLLDMPNLSQDPTWTDVFWRVPEAEMAERVEGWLVDVAGLPVARTLPPVEDLRGIQRQSMTSSLTTARDSVLTWCEVNEAPAPPAIDVAPVSAQIRSSGYLDFGERTSDEFVFWLAAHGYWPADMPHTLNRRELGITQEDLRKARDRKRREAEEAKRRESAITFEGQDYTGDPDDVLKLDEAIAAAIAGVDLGETPAMDLLNELPPTTLTGIGGSGKPKPTKPIRATAAPPGKIENIGLAGEIFAGHWIASNFGLPREETWRSGYRNDIIGDRLGDDSLGYDFEVLAGDLTYLIEVKATTGDDTAFQLPESEIRRALNLAPHERYTILFVNNVLDTQLRRFHWLPNPLGPDARLFRVEGREMKFRFDARSGEGP